MSETSLIQELHEENQASFREEEGLVVPSHFGTPEKEVAVVRSALGLLDCRADTLIRFEGPDRLSFLHGLLSNDVKGLAPGAGNAAAFLDISGKILADVKLLRLESSLLVVLRRSLKPNVLNHLDRYLIGDEVEIKDLTEDYGILSIQGPQSRTFLKQLLNEQPLPSKELEHVSCGIKTTPVLLAQNSRTGEEGFDFYVPASETLSIARLLQENASSFSGAWIGSEAQEILRLEAGIPRYGIDMDQNNLLLETGLDRAVSFQKGCYLGQEVVERMRSRGHVNKKLMGLVIEGKTAAERNDSIARETTTIGHVTSSLFSPTLQQPLALAYIHRDFLQPGNPVTVLSRGIPLQASIVALPFYRRTP